MSVLNYCFNGLSSIQGVSYNQRQAYRMAWDSFRTVEIYNSNVSTQRGEGNINATYYQFPSSESQSQYKEGQSLFYYYLGYSNVVKKN
jgi:hypothetical protein